MRARVAKTNRVWGEDFADDGFWATAGVCTWNDLGENELARFFPSLARVDQPIAARVLIRIRRSADRIARDVHAVRKDASLNDWTPVFAVDAAWLISICDQGDHPAQAPEISQIARFAFLTGVHPAYVWSCCASVPHEGAVAAWLGEFSRAGAALMPRDVADYLCDATGEESGCAAALTTLVRSPELTAILAEAARNCLQGESIVVKWPPRWRWLFLWRSRSANRLRT